MLVWKKYNVLTFGPFDSGNKQVEE